MTAEVILEKVALKMRRTCKVTYNLLAMASNLVAMASNL